jgi:hypothetical protein
LYDWIALRRVSGGGIAGAGDCWFDGGRRVPDHVADALVTLCEAGLVALAGPNSTTMARAALTDAGAERFEQLCQQRQKALQVGAAQIGATLCGRATADQIGLLLAICRLLALRSGTNAQPAESQCPTCAAQAAAPAPTTQRHSPADSGRPPVEQPPRQIHAPDGRPDTTTPGPASATTVADHRTDMGC